MSSNKKLGSYLYILPILVLMVFFWYVTIGYSFLLSFYEYNGLRAPKFIGIANYKKLLTDQVFIKSLKTTGKYMIFIAPTQVILAFFVAIWVDMNSRKKTTKFVRNALIIPTLASTSVLGIVIRIMLNNPSSPLVPILSIFGLKSSQMLGSQNYAVATIIVIKILIGMGYYMLLYMSSLSNISRSIYEAAYIDGASNWRIYTKIAFPIVKKTTILLIFLSAIEAFKIFDLVYVMTGGGPGNGATLTPVIHLYMSAFKYSKIGYAMSMSIVVILIALLILSISRILMGYMSRKEGRTFEEKRNNES